MKALVEWFIEEKRSFPWRLTPTPYRVWVSEVMLQQTQASVVIPYFERWMARFPTLISLAEASLEEVIKLWEGLGYYSRARSLLEGAKYLVTYNNGEFPSSAAEILKVKGIGPYTVGAICSFAFHQRMAAVDGNVLRVISRLFLIDQEINKPSVQKLIKEKVEEILPFEKPWVAMEALIELGALICTKKPKCALCPLQEMCLAYAKGLEEELPRKKKPPSSIPLFRTVPIIYHEGYYLIQKHEEKKVMKGLYEFPYFENEIDWSTFFPFSLTLIKKLKEVKHTFTRYRAHLFPTLWKADQLKEIEGYEWISKNRLKELPFSSGHRRVLSQVLEEDVHLTY